MNGRELFDPYAASSAPPDVDEDLDEAPARPTTTATPASSAPRTGEARPPLERVRLGEGLVIRLLAAARRSGCAAPRDPKLVLELRALRLELLAWVALAGAELDVRGLVRVLAPEAAAGPELVEDLAHALERAERALPRLERPAAAQRGPQRARNPAAPVEVPTTTTKRARPP